MKKYIPLDALVAEIEKLKGKVNDSSSYCNGWQHALRMLELSLGTLEVKEVDINKLCEFRKNIGFAYPEGASEYQKQLACYRQGIKDAIKAQKGE